MPSSALFQSIDLRGVTVRNRLWAAPMCQYAIADRSGIVGDWHLMHLGSIAAGGAGLVIAEATAVNAEGRISPFDTGIWNDEQRDAWRRLVDFQHAQGAVAGIQLAHAGRKASVYPAWGTDAVGTVPEAEGGWTTVAPSAVAFGGYAEPVALTTTAIGSIVDDFRAAARRAVDAGFDVLELHAAHGYLIHQFLSPLSNRRTDEYGGGLEDRARFLLEVISAVRTEVGETVPVLVRFSATDYAPGGWDEAQTAVVAGWSQAAGADFFDISTGGLVSGVRIPLGPLYQVPFAEYVGREADTPVSAVGLITTAEQAEAVVASGRADAVMLGRELLRDPHFPLRAAHELGVEVDYWPGQYRRARWPQHA
ncbi:NADH:flavin oxidoreductase/NADH oxidase [Microbacteriaceae bacterium VKM Ac-2855]|nr:NADH:flavin oxidoreductase/NADH oxidase [Microbacteriaceae bacterium VKM Ac-2855]